MGRPKKEKVVKIFNPDEDGKILRDAFKEASEAKSKRDLYNDSLKDIKKRAVNETGIKLKQFNEMFTMYLNSDREEREEKSQETYELYDKVMKSNDKPSQSG